VGSEGTRATIVAVTWTILGLDEHPDATGVLRTLSEVPFVVRRIFTVSEVPVNGVRGGHAHRNCDQVLIAAMGQVDVALDAPGGATVNLLAGQGVHVPAGTWSQQTYRSADACLLVLASHPYDETDYLESSA
jgi:mannose-6-phosphate isomerase-like protein (cupin superfamily)